MIFEPGKFYKHTSGKMISTLDFLETTMWGRTLIVEESGNPGLNCVATDSESFAVNYTEISKEEWMSKKGGPITMTR